MDRAGCVGHDPETWFRTTQKRRALAICSGCPVRTECLVLACRVRLDVVELSGVWAGRPPEWFKDRRQAGRVLGLLAGASQ